MFPSLTNSNPSFSIDDNNGNNKTGEKNHTQIHDCDNKENLSNSVTSKIKISTDGNEIEDRKFGKLFYHDNAQPTKDVIESYGGVLGTLGSSKFTKKKESEKE